MIVTSIKGGFGLSGKAALTTAGTTGSITVGQPVASVSIADSDILYHLEAVIADAATLQMDQVTGSVISDPVWGAGTAQVETATAAGTITTAGNMTVTVTAAGLTGSPLAITVAVALDDTAATWAGKVRTALAANAAVAAMFTVSGTTTAIVLTRKPVATYTLSGSNDGSSETTVVNVYAANDTTLNIALADDTSAGITEAATSANTTAGVVTTGCYVIGGNSKDVNGATLAEMATRMSYTITLLGETGMVLDVTGDPKIPAEIHPGDYISWVNTAASITPAGPDFLADAGSCLFRFTIAAAA